MAQYLQIVQGVAFGITFLLILVFVNVFVMENSSAHQTNTNLVISALRYNKHYQIDNYITVTDDDIAKYPKLKEALNSADLSYKVSSIFGRGAKSLLHVNLPYVISIDGHDAMAIVNGLNFVSDGSQLESYSADVEYKKGELGTSYYHISIKFQ